MEKEDGMISISMLIVLSLMAVFSLYIWLCHNKWLIFDEK